MNSDFYNTVLELQNTGSSFVTATVVSRRAPVSSHLGDRALIFPDGRMQGFVGGSCSREIVRTQALEALHLGKPRLVLIRPDATPETVQHAASAESVTIPMTCASEGAVDVYLEPHLAAPLLLVAGFTPVAEAVARMAALLEYNVVRVVTAQELPDLELQNVVALVNLPTYLQALPAAARANTAAVVATQGHYDEPVLEALLLANIGFVSLLASRKRAVTVRELLELQGVTPEQLATIKNPAGIDIQAKTPPEVALSILAEIIQARASSQPMFTNSSHYQPRKNPLNEGVAPQARGEFAHGEFATSPVDGEQIEIATAIHFANHNGTTYYFTCANCKRRFLKDPLKFLAVNP